MRCQKARGETTVEEAGIYDTDDERNRGSVVAAAISWMEPGSGVSGVPTGDSLAGRSVAGAWA